LLGASFPVWVVAILPFTYLYISLSLRGVSVVTSPMPPECPPFGGFIAALAWSVLCNQPRHRQDALRCAPT
jgi:hypothetical protein